MALDMHSEVARLNSENKISINIRVGIHAGPVVAGVIGVRKFSYDLWGDAVNTAARMESHGIPGLSQMTEQMYNIISGSGKFDIEDRGIIDVKGRHRVGRRLEDRTQQHSEGRPVVEAVAP